MQQVLELAEVVQGHQGVGVCPVDPPNVHLRYNMPSLTYSTIETHRDMLSTSSCGHQIHEYH